MRCLWLDLEMSQCIGRGLIVVRHYWVSMENTDMISYSKTTGQWCGNSSFKSRPRNEASDFSTIWIAPGKQMVYVSCSRLYRLSKTFWIPDFITGLFFVTMLFLYLSLYSLCYGIFCKQKIMHELSDNLAPPNPFTLLFRSPGCENTWDHHEDNSPLTPAGASLLGWTIWTERLIRLHARRWGFWGRPWRLWSSSWSATPGAPRTCVSLPLPMSSSSGPVFWLG